MTVAVNTDAKVSLEDRPNTLSNTGSASTNNQVWTLEDENIVERTVETRLNRDGSRAYLYLRNEPGVGIVPVVLATIDKDGALTYGGSGGIFDKQQNKITNSVVTTPQQAKDLLSGGLINGVGATIEEQLKLGDTKAQVLAKAANSNSTTANQNQFSVSQRLTAGPGAQTLTVEPFTVIPGQGLDPAGGNVTETAVSPGNNDPNASNDDNIITKITEDPGAALGEAWEYIKKEAPRFFENMKLSDEDIALFEGLFEAGGGDPIEGAQYPYDNTYGQIRGQDYVTIDQFIYQPPRRNQILGDRRPDGTNPIENIFQGSQRLSPLKKLVATVKLPMPNDITDSNAVSWGDDAMNNMSAALTSAVMRNPGAGLAGGIMSMLNPTIGKAVTLAGAALDNEGIDGPGGRDASVNGRIQAVMKMMEQDGMGVLSKTQMGAGILGMLGVNVSPESLLSRGFGVIPNSNTELLFNNVTLRDFQFSWRMSPRDEQEALVVKRIIRFFKQGMAAKTQKNQAGERSIYLGAPNVFRLQYRTAGGRIIEGVNRIKPCAVVGTAVNYTPDGQWSAYDEGQPVSCTLSIQMKELEPVYASDYSMNVIESRRSNDKTGSSEQFTGPFADPNRAVQDIGVSDGDLYSIRPTEVGY